jgi:HK97 gp10 family phage protein
VRIVVHYGQIVAMMSPAGDVGRATARAAGRLRDRAKRNASVDKGLMRNSITAELKQQGATNVTWTVGTDVVYAKWQEHGTPPIFARRAPMLVFQVNGRWVSTYSTRGVPAQHFLQRAANDVTENDFL